MGHGLNTDSGRGSLFHMDQGNGNCYTGLENMIFSLFKSWSLIVTLQIQVKNIINAPITMLC